MSKVRIALCQFALRDTHSFEELEDHITDQFYEALSQGPDLIVFPEFLSFGLLAMAGANLTYNGLGHAMVEYLAAFTPRYESLFSNLAKENAVVIAGGSHWIMDNDEGKGFNTAHLFYPDGRIERQKKNHLFPGETDWNTAPFDGLVVLETPKAKVGLMTCYDAEFPEVARYFMLKGAEILLCPSATYTIRGFYRVRRCCAARAVENQIYVVECHQVGSLGVPLDRPFAGFGRSAILCPIDDQTMVDDGIIVEAKKGEEETVIVGEVNIEVLSLSRQSSEATILKDRRPETYKTHYQLF